MVALVVLLVAGNFAVLTYLQKPDAPSLELRANNAGVPLAPEDARVSIHVAGQHGELAAEGALGEVFPLPPGRYEARVVLTRSRDQQSQRIKGITLSERKREVKHVEFSAGELSVEATIGTGSDESGQVVVYVFTPQDHNKVVTSMLSGQRVVLRAGLYDVRVVLTVESKEKAITWLHGVEVKAGLDVRRDAAFHRGVLSLKASNAGTVLPRGSATFVVYRAGDAQEEVMDSGGVGDPLGLAVGRYDVKVTFMNSNDKPTRWLRDLEIRESETLDVTTEFSSGTLKVNAEIEGGETLGDFQVYVYYYNAGDHQAAVAYCPAGVEAILESGRYDVRAHFFRSHDRPNIWRRNITVTAGEVETLRVAFSSGKLLVRAYEDAGTELLGDNVFVYVYAAGERSRPIAISQSAVELILLEGIYDLRVEDTRNPSQEVWLEGVHIASGKLTERSATFSTASSPR